MKPEKVVVVECSMTPTDQDGNFRVGGLFNVEQLQLVLLHLMLMHLTFVGLQELRWVILHLVTQEQLSTNSSNHGTFAPNSDSIAPTQRAIKTYITSQIGGGGTLNVNLTIIGILPNFLDKKLLQPSSSSRLT